MFALIPREQYSINSIYEMQITAALIQCASDFNENYSANGLHLKVCIADEIFPYLRGEYIPNPIKHIRDELYLYWKPKDLLRLLCWRLFKFLEESGNTKLKESDVDWESYKDIYGKIWKVYFGEKLTNRRGREENTFPYILRHTHLRPRQVVYICNKIAKISMRKKEFPYFSPQAIVQGVYNSEIALADSIINAYSKI